MDNATSWLTATHTRPIARQPPDFEQIFSQFGGPVYRFLCSQVGNREDAEDLTSEVFLKAACHLDTGRPEVSIASWLYVVARTVMADHWRRYYRTVPVVPIGQASLAEMPNGTDRSERSEQMTRRIAEALRRLPDRHRGVLELRFLYGYSVVETAGEMGLTLGNVKVIQHRALAKAAHIGESCRE